MTKVYNGYGSKYYFRKFRKIKTRSTPIIEQDDYEIYKLSFAETIFSDENYQFVFNEDIDITDLVDNLGRPLSELYLTMVKTTSNGIFTSVVSGIEAPIIPELANSNSNPFINNVPVIQRMHGASGSGIPTSSIPLESGVSINNLDFYGDLVEYNISTVQEVVLADVHHRFNTVNRETTSNSIVSGPRPEGYYYKAHQLIRIRDFSSYIEEGTVNTAGKPDYSSILGDRYLWRDLFDIGRIDINKDTVNYPFINGCHYMYNNYPFQVRRQDPFDDWNLYHSGFPSDPIGNTMNKTFNINSADNVC